MVGLCTSNVKLFGPPLLLMFHAEGLRAGCDPWSLCKCNCLPCCTAIALAGNAPLSAMLLVCRFPPAHSYCVRHVNTCAGCKWCWRTLCCGRSERAHQPLGGGCDKIEAWRPPHPSKRRHVRVLGKDPQRSLHFAMDLVKCRGVAVGWLLNVPLPKIAWGPTSAFPYKSHQVPWRTQSCGALLLVFAHWCIHTCAHWRITICAHWCFHTCAMRTLRGMVLLNCFPAVCWLTFTPPRSNGMQPALGDENGASKPRRKAGPLQQITAPQLHSCVHFHAAPSMQFQRGHAAQAHGNLPACRCSSAWTN